MEKVNYKKIRCPKCGNRLEYLGDEDMANFDCDRCPQRYSYKDLIRFYLERYPMKKEKQKKLFEMLYNILEDKMEVKFI